VSHLCAAISHAPYAEGGKAGIAKSFARIHWQNLVNFGVLPLTVADPSDYECLQPSDTIRIAGVVQALTASREIRAEVEGSDEPLRLCHALSERQIDIQLAGGAINWRHERQSVACRDALRPEK